MTKNEWTKAILLGPVSPGMKAIQLFDTGEIVLVSRHVNSRPVDPEHAIFEFELEAPVKTGQDEFLDEEV